MLIIFLSERCFFNILVNGYYLTFINVYLNSGLCKVNTQEQYFEDLAKLEWYVNDLNYDYILSTGAFNADFFSGRAWVNSSNFIIDNSLKCFDVAQVHNDTFAFVG